MASLLEAATQLRSTVVAILRTLRLYARLRSSQINSDSLLCSGRWRNSFLVVTYLNRGSFHASIVVVRMTPLVIGNALSCERIAKLFSILSTVVASVVSFGWLPDGTMLKFMQSVLQTGNGSSNRQLWLSGPAWKLMVWSKFQLCWCLIAIAILCSKRPSSPCPSRSPALHLRSMPSHCYLDCPGGFLLDFQFEFSFCCFNPLPYWIELDSVGFE